MFNKKIMKSALIGVFLLAFGSIANAAEYDINMYGASAEYNYWNASDVAFLTFLGCGAADIYKAHTADSNHSVTFCAGNTAFAGKSGAGATYAADGLAGDTVVLRYSNKASYDGIEAVQGLDAFNTNNGNGCTNKQRMMGDASKCRDTSSGTPNTACPTSFGNPASSRHCRTASADAGASSADFKITEQPAATGAPSLRPGLPIGKFQGANAATGPTGS